jgi:hypothetical protein
VCLHGAAIRRPAFDKDKLSLPQVFDFLGLPPHRIVDCSAKNTRRYDPLSPETRKRLDGFFAPFNEQLAHLLGRDDIKEKWSYREERL